MYHSLLATSTCINMSDTAQWEKVTDICLFCAKRTARISAIIMTINLSINFDNHFIAIISPIILAVFLAKSTADIMAILLIIISARFLTRFSRILPTLQS